jgi:hypothetical protein
LQRASSGQPQEGKVKARAEGDLITCCEGVIASRDCHHGICQGE